jgi:hypothetical protein
LGGETGVALRTLAVTGLSLVVGLAAGLYAKDKDTVENVDSGSFAVLRNGRRVATEKFSVQKNANGSFITSQLKAETGPENGSQNAELKLSTGGDLVRYEWHGITPEKADLVVMPSEQFLIERVTLAGMAKPAEQPFLMPSSTMILDNNSFVQREVLAWRYLATSCKQESGKTLCPKDPAQFGVLVPQDRLSMKVTLEPVGLEKISINGRERQLLRLNLKDEGGEWALWLDDQNMFKLMRIVIVGDNTEIVRD